MGLGGISFWQLLIILLIVLALFGTKRLKDIGPDLGSAIKGFRSAMGHPDKEAEEAKLLEVPTSPTGTATPDPAAKVEGRDKV